MDHEVGVWIDHRKAVVVSTSGDKATTKTVESNVGSHARYSGQAEYPTSNGPQSGRGEKKFEQRFSNELDRYYDLVIKELGQPTELLIFGPGEAKLQLRRRLSHVKVQAERVVAIETADSLTESQIVAHVKGRFGRGRKSSTVPSRA